MTPDPPPPSSYTPVLPPLAAQGGTPLYVTGEDALACTVFNASAGVTVTISGRMLEFGQARPTPFQQTIIPATDRSASVVRFSLGDGWLLNAQAVVSGGSPFTGQTFVRLSLVRGLLSNANELFTLCADYVTSKQPVSYPGSGVLDPTDGCGALRSITGAVPAAGAEISETVPTGARWELISIAWLLTTAVAVANRSPNLILDDGALVYFRSSFATLIPASVASQNTFAQGIGQFTSANNARLASTLPVNNRLAAGHRVRTSTDNIQAADQYSAIQYLVREWIEGA